MNIETKFEPGDLVTLRAMIAAEALSGGFPQILSVVYVSVEWNKGQAPGVRYYCRAIQTWQPRNQTFLSDRLVNGLVLVDEEELVPYPAKEPEEAEDKP